MIVLQHGSHIKSRYVYAYLNSIIWPWGYTTQTTKPVFYHIDIAYISHHDFVVSRDVLCGLSVTSWNGIMWHDKLGHCNVLSNQIIRDSTDLLACWNMLNMRKMCLDEYECKHWTTFNPWTRQLMPGVIIVYMAFWFWLPVRTTFSHCCRSHHCPTLTHLMISCWIMTPGK